MILQASQRGGGQNLAAHLMRGDDNEHIELHEIRGFVSDDLHGAFKEAYAVSKGTKCKQYLFSLSLNPPPDEDVPIEVFEQTIAKAEERLGLGGQPRAVVFHEKEGRRHAHCVWSRIDAETMTAKQMSFFKMKLFDLSRELYLEHDWRMPRGFVDKSLRNPRNFTLSEWQQAKRNGQDPRELKTAVQDAWAVSDNCNTFEHALQERGYWLARGDRRAHVVVDYQGEVHSVPRALGKKAKEVRAKLGDPAQLHSVEETKRTIAATMTPLMKKHIDHSRMMFERRKAHFDEKRLKMRDEHMAQRRDISSKQRERKERESTERAKKLPKGLRRLWSRITGQYKKLKKTNELDANECALRDKRERDELVAVQLERRRELQSVFAMHRKQHSETLLELRQDMVRFRALEREANAPKVKRRLRRRDPSRDLN